jgi:dihydroxy-acid dehydratase
LKQRHIELEKNGGYKVPESQTPWQEIFRKETDQLAQGMVLKGAVKFQRVGKVHPVPRDNH